MELQNIEQNERNVNQDKVFRISWQVSAIMNQLNVVYNICKNIFRDGWIILIQLVVNRYLFRGL